MIYKLKHGDDIKYFGQIAPDHDWTSDDLAYELDASFEMVDALYSFHNIPLLMLAYNNSEDETKHDWYMKIDEDDEFEYSFIEKIPEQDWYTWEQIAFILDTNGYLPYSNDDTAWYDSMEKEEQQTFNRLGIREI